MPETTTQLSESEENHAPTTLELWICCHCGNPRLYGSGACKYCGAQLHDTGQYVRQDVAVETNAALREQLAGAQNDLELARQSLLKMCDAMENRL